MLEIFTVRLFNQERNIRVYLPNNYDGSTIKYPVLYMHDGQNVFGREEAIGGESLELHAYLEKNNVDLIVVAIDQNTAGDERINEYCPWRNGEFSERLLGSKSESGGKGAKYVDFIVNDLKPFIDGKYRTLEEKSFMAGISLGGLISIYAASCYPHIFKRAAALSPAFYRNQEKIEEMLKSTSLSHIEKLYLDCGTAEVPTNNQISELFLLSNKSVYEILKNKGMNINFSIIDGAEHHYLAFKKRVHSLIEFFISDK
ncbi:alpha/beta hydrolase [Bacillus sp. ISL-47]|uniref:alpha/beta hydrolase n=1 Tax=Bacillus sp. ISL-47 TaxID=2819130 RepID=UPI001BEA6754|nr:alpha/beta hydrolase-fold protein [Bacillus sp. ISL-47]MBT2686569.1 alpha/beta hydrolase [Bacillus sp. ISL-47]MBT2706961.1 alpha/beta hydrolase [Pseudomonas sp. ISL-84]